jgi:hypothetical protein
MSSCLHGQGALHVTPGARSSGNARTTVSICCLGEGSEDQDFPDLHLNHGWIMHLPKDGPHRLLDV